MALLITGMTERYKGKAWNITTNITYVWYVFLERYLIIFEVTNTFGFGLVLYGECVEEMFTRIAGIKEISNVSCTFPNTIG